MDLRGKEIFIIDDDEQILILMRKILENNGIKVETFSNPQKAVEALNHSSPNLVMIDLNFGNHNISGFDILSVRMKDPTLLKIPFIVLSGLSDHKMIKQAIKLKADDFIQKPINTQIIQIKLRKFFLKEQTLRYVFETEEELDLTGVISAQITHISENSLQISSQVKYSNHSSMAIDGNRIQQLEAKACLYETMSDAIAVDIGYYKSKVKIIGVNNVIASNIRKL